MLMERGGEVKLKEYECVEVKLMWKPSAKNIRLRSTSGTVYPIFSSLNSS